MRLKQEQTVFLIAVLLLGWMTWDLLGDSGAGARSRKRAREAAFEHFQAPAVDVTLPDGDAPPLLTRELFSPPRDTRPLPPLDLVEPPRAPLAGLLPPTEPGPAPQSYALLRFALEPVDLPELFANLGEPDDFQDDLSFLDETEKKRTGSMIAALREEVEDDPYRDETPAARIARIEGYKSRYDWVARKNGVTIFGRIGNEDRFGLVTDPSRSEEELLFVQIDPDTGVEVFGNVGEGMIPEPRSRVDTFGFANTVANEIEIESRRIGPSISRSSYDEALALADYCVRHRLDAGRALEVAEELYRKCVAFDAEDPEPRIGLARCHEAAFDFERAFEEYEALLEDFDHRAVIHARLGLLEERFLLFESAEERLRTGVSKERGSWETRWALGSFLERRGRYTEAIEHLQQANRSAPSDPSQLHVRVGIRNALASALFAAGEVTEAHRVFAQAASADDRNQIAKAGRLATALLDASMARDDGMALGGDASEEGVGLELLLARGVASLAAGSFERARDQLLLASEADPLRANRPLAALSFLAEVTGNSEEALRFADEALAVDPTDAYAWYQRGRILSERDDYEGARTSLLTALEQELDFEDALAALGDMAFRLGRFEDAERYLERAIGLAPERAEVHALRGMNFLRLRQVFDARASFEASKALAGDDPIARAGLAWCTYLEGDSQEAMILLGNLDESRRSLPEDDPYRVWARDQIDRLREHLEKEAWTDPLNRKRLANNWSTSEGDGVEVSMLEGAVRIDGAFQQSRTVSVFRDYPANAFVSFEADLWIAPETVSNCGLRVWRERQRRGEMELTDEAAVLRHKEGNVQVRFQRSGQKPASTDMQQTFAVGEWVHLRIDRTGESSESTVTISLDGIPLVEGVSMPSLGKGSSNALLVGFFVEGEAGRVVDARMDNVEVVYRK